MSARNFLLVDDDCEDTELFTEAVGSVDASVACLNAADGKDALEKLSGRPGKLPDIIFLDINMPIMDGWQFLSRIKTREELRMIPVIMYSTSTDKADVKAAISSGALCFFTKPNNFQRLKKIMQIVLSYMERGDLDHVCEAIQKA